MRVLIFSLRAVLMFKFMWTLFTGTVATRQGAGNEMRSLNRRSHGGITLQADIHETTSLSNGPDRMSRAILISEKLASSNMTVRRLPGSRLTNLKRKGYQDTVDSLARPRCLNLSREATEGFIRETALQLFQYECG